MATSRPSAEPAHHVVLVGMMGAGKSSVGALLAERLGLQHFDVDAWIEDEEGASIGTIFATRGEAAFRALEAQMLPSFLAAERPCVLSVGGGAVTQEGTREKLAGAGRVVWLRARTDTLVERGGDAST